MFSALHWLCDMDGVLINDDRMVNGADQFLHRLQDTGRTFLVLTNNSLYAPGQLSTRLKTLGLPVEEHQLWTSALATAQFVRHQIPSGSAYVIGESSMHEALDAVGYRESTRSPDYVVVGETWSYSFDEIARAIQFIEKGSSFVATNPETTSATPDGSLPGCGALTALIQSATGVSPYVVGKPNPVMIRDALNILGAHSGSTIMVGDRMDTDIQSGTEAGVETILVLSGVTQSDDVTNFAYRPSHVTQSVADLVDLVT
jgi:NagD protein